LKPVPKPTPKAAAKPSRRTPLQDRSRQRMERILDAAAHVFSEAGYDAATTEAIAERAGTSIGSLYQFFPNKLALFNAIAMRYLERGQTLFDSFMTSEAASLPWLELLDRAIDAFADFHEREPGFRAILLNWRVSTDMVVANDEVNREFARRAEQVLAIQSPGLSPARRALVATLIIEVVSAMLIVRARRADVPGPDLIHETKTMLKRYLEPIATEHPGDAPAPAPGSRSRRAHARKKS
jgi:AcrR family transcriptional regulator